MGLLWGDTHLHWPARPAIGPRGAAAPPGSARSAARRSGTSVRPCPPLSPRSHTAPWWPLSGGRRRVHCVRPQLGQGTRWRELLDPLTTPIPSISAQKFPASHICPQLHYHSRGARWRVQAGGRTGILNHGEKITWFSTFFLL